MRHIVDLASCLEWQRANSEKIGRLARLGEPLAKRLVEAYTALYGDKLNPYLQSEWMAVCDDFCRRDLMLDTRRILQDRFGHKLPPKDPLQSVY
jgi:hypothetical protein